MHIDGPEPIVRMLAISTSGCLSTRSKTRWTSRPVCELRRRSCGCCSTRASRPRRGSVPESVHATVEVVPPREFDRSLAGSATPDWYLFLRARDAGSSRLPPGLSAYLSQRTDRARLKPRETGRAEPIMGPSRARPRARRLRRWLHELPVAAGQRPTTRPVTGPARHQGRRRDPEAGRLPTFFPRAERPMGRTGSYVGERGAVWAAYGLVGGVVVRSGRRGREFNLPHPTRSGQVSGDKAGSLPTDSHPGRRSGFLRGWHRRLLMQDELPTACPFDVDARQ
jgi:hypothetical protein